MTFRIDGIIYRDDQWEFRFKGVEGKGVYGTLIARTGGLFLVDDRMTGRATLLIPDIAIPGDATKQEASRRLADALNRAGWGPEVNQAGTIVDSETYIYPPGRF